MKKPAFSHRSCYVNGAEHLQNAWNVNLMYPNAPGRWSEENWKAFFKEIHAFGYNCFEFWIPPTLMVPGEERDAAAGSLVHMMELAHTAGLRFKPLLCVNCLGAAWYFACPKDPDDHARILEAWDFWSKRLAGTDIFSIFPGDPGGCNRNGCTHETFLELALELTVLIKKNSPASSVEVGTWGTPFTGWGDDMIRVPCWDGSWKMLLDGMKGFPETPAHIWNGKPERVAVSMNHLLKRIECFPEDTLFSVNMGFNGVSEPLWDLSGKPCKPPAAYDGRPWAKQIAKSRRVTTWDYPLSEGELINYPHWRLPRMREKRLMEQETGAYFGGMIYTMTPKLNQLTLYAGGQFFLDPNRSAEEVSSEFTRLVFGDGAIGPLMEAFEIVDGWGHYPRRIFTAEESQIAFKELIDRLEACKGYPCVLPLFPDPETYRQDLLWHARNFLELTGPHPDRTRIRKSYWDKALHIYDLIPMSADERADLAADGYAAVGMKKQ